jgi:glycosyltransferase involved in cell wall biosynthesis
LTSRAAARYKPAIFEEELHLIRAAVFNAYLSTWGGGERSTYAIATALARLGMDVEVLTFESKVPTQAEIDAFFGPGNGGFRIRSLTSENGLWDDALRACLEKTAVFVNHCAGSAFANPCPLGLYFVMFPFQDAGAWVQSYQHFVCNSEFTRRYTVQRWLSRSTEVLYPAAEDVAYETVLRRPDVVTIGRFNWRGHAKNQRFLVDAFDEVLDLLPRNARLVLLGKYNDDPDNREALRALQERCRRLPVSFEINVPEQRKREILSGASVFWLGTGVGKEEPAGASEMEHFGIAVVEAMRAGLVPLCYHLGGPREIIEHARSGFLYRDLEELKTYTVALFARRDIQDSMRAKAVQRSARFTRAERDRALDRFIRSVVIA